MRPSTLRVAAAIPVLVTLLGVLTACADNTASEDVASATDLPAASAASASPGATDSDQDRKFAQCIRDNGVPEFPDPDGEDGMRGVLMNSDIDRNKLRTAMEACQDLRPNGGERQQLEVAEQEQRLEWAQCVRDNGVDMPDPDPDKAGFLLPGSNIDPGDPAFQKAMEACQDKFVSGGGSR